MYRGTVAAVMLGSVALNLGDSARAGELATAGLALARRFDDRWHSAMCLMLLGHVALAEDDAGRAEAHLDESAALMETIGNRLYLSWCLEGLAGVAAAHEDWERAAQLWGARDGLRARMRSPLPPMHRAGFARTLTAIRAALDEPALAAARADGEAMPVGELIGRGAVWNR